MDITTNNQQAPSNISYYGYGIADDLDLAAELLDDDMIDPLFDDDWLHENNLDFLFDLFEEEIESKIGADQNSGSSALFGTSPVTSYLFGTSPSLASTLDLLYQQQANGGPTIQQQQSATVASTNTGKPNTSTISNLTTSTISNSSDSSKSTSTFNVSGSKLSHGGGSSVTNSITNAMRIKRGLKKGQSEGISLLAKPFAANYSAKANGIGEVRSSSSQQQHHHQPKPGKVYLHNCKHHIHQITGRAIIHEHAYAVRGH